uniref:OrfB_Zn_ribbon domain-containing protein n=1 Tax=Haemonchus contortus TaxID=6289 RepID=A0A7I4Z747_HAECO
MKFIFFSTISTLTPYLSGPGASKNQALGVNSPFRHAGSRSQSCTLCEGNLVVVDRGREKNSATMPFRCVACKKPLSRIGSVNERNAVVRVSPEKTICWTTFAELLWGEWGRHP